MKQISKKIKYGGEEFILYQAPNSRVYFTSKNYCFYYENIEKFKIIWFDIKEDIEKSLIKVIWI